MSPHEAKWWFVTLSFFLLGAMWSYIVLFTYGTPFFVPYLIVGVVTAATGMAFGRTARLVWDATRPRAWKIRGREW